MEGFSETRRPHFQEIVSRPFNQGPLRLATVLTRRFPALHREQTRKSQEGAFTDKNCLHCRFIAAIHDA